MSARARDRILPAFLTALCATASAAEWPRKVCRNLVRLVATPSTSGKL
jgi:hypothetical protein